MVLISWKQPLGDTEMKHLHGKRTHPKATQAGPPCSHACTQWENIRATAKGRQRAELKNWHKLIKPSFQAPSLVHLVELKYFQSLLGATTVVWLLFFFKFKYSLVQSNTYRCWLQPGPPLQGRLRSGCASRSVSQRTFLSSRRPHDSHEARSADGTPESRGHMTCP